VRQALHIFKKDARYLRWELGALLVMLGMSAYTQVRVRATHGVDRGQVVMLLLIALLAFLCARLIQAETIPGDRQFWITRPYEWRSLLGAKLLFVVVFMSIPLMVADAVVLAISGFSVTAHVTGLLWSMVLTTVGLLATLCAFATLTRGLAQWALALLLTIGALIALDSIGKGNVWGGLEWVREHGDIAISLITASMVLLWQYRGRRTARSIAVMAAGLLAAWAYADYAPTPFGLEARWSKPKVDPSAIQITVHPPAERTVRPDGFYRMVQNREAIPLALPLNVTGLAPGMDVISDDVDVSLTAEGQTRDLEQNISSTLEHQPDGYRQTLLIDRAIFDRLKGQRVRLQVTQYLTLLGNPVSRIVEFRGKPVGVPGVGLCSGWGPDLYKFVYCVSPLREASNVLVMERPGQRGRFFNETSYSPLPADASTFPLHWHQTSFGPLTDFPQATLISLEPLAHFRREIDLPDIDLADYVMPLPGKAKN
jgi:hypothetical protein